VTAFPYRVSIRRPIFPDEGYPAPGYLVTVRAAGPIGAEMWIGDEFADEYPEAFIYAERMCLSKVEGMARD
jgi:hypothetical protein